MLTIYFDPIKSKGTKILFNLPLLGNQDVRKNVKINKETIKKHDRKNSPSIYKVSEIKSFNHFSDIKRDIKLTVLQIFFPGHLHYSWRTSSDLLFTVLCIQCPTCRVRRPFPDGKKDRRVKKMQYRCIGKTKYHILTVYNFFL